MMVLGLLNLSTFLYLSRLSNIENIHSKITDNQQDKHFKSDLFNLEVLVMGPSSYWKRQHSFSYKNSISLLHGKEVKKV